MKTATCFQIPSVTGCQLGLRHHFISVNSATRQAGTTHAAGRSFIQTPPNAIAVIPLQTTVPINGVTTFVRLRLWTDSHDLNTGFDGNTRYFETVFMKQNFVGDLVAHHQSHFVSAIQWTAPVNLSSWWNWEWVLPDGTPYDPAGTFNTEVLVVTRAPAGSVCNVPAEFSMG